MDRHGTREVAKAYLDFLYSPKGQELAAKHYYRPRSEEALAKHGAAFPKVSLFTIDEVFGGWRAAQRTHFADGGTFDALVAA